MNPEGDKILNLSVQRLGTAIAPLVGETFAQGQIGLIGFMLTLVANEYERGADLRAGENKDIRKLFSELAPKIADATMKTRIEAAANSHDKSLRISALNTANHELRRLLAELHAHVESLNGARDAERRIWSLLRKIAANRLVTLAPQQ
jgi:hypothetical protein